MLRPHRSMLENTGLRGFPFSCALSAAAEEPSFGWKVCLPTGASIRVSAEGRPELDAFRPLSVIFCSWFAGEETGSDDNS